MTAPFDLAIRGGTVVTDTDVRRLDVGVRGSRIVAVGEHIGPATRDLDASGRFVMPGGIDAHCHIDQRSSSGLMTADDFYTGGVSAACGGTTTILPFAAQHRGQRLRDVVTDYRRRAEERAFVDYGFHLIVSDPSEAVLREDLPELVAQGCPSLKVYLTYEALKLTDRQLLDVYDAASALGAIVLVHAENHEAVAWQTRRLVAAGKTEPRHHPASRPALAEGEATHRAIALAGLAGAAVFIVHVSCREALAPIVEAKSQRRRVWAETCPHYLVLAAADMDRPGFEMAKFVCSPPLRTAADQAALWQALAAGDLDLVASDHAPYRLHDVSGKLAHGPEAPFTAIPNGMPGLELRLPLLYSEGVAKGRLTLSRFVALASSNPARLYGMFPRKGAIAVGSDADLVVWDPDREAVVRQASLHDAMDYTPFEGMRLKGWPACTVSRGEIVWDGESVHGEAGRGRFVPRAPLEA